MGFTCASVHQDTQEQHVQSVLQDITNMETVETGVIVRMLLIKSQLLLSVDIVLMLQIDLCKD